MTKETNIAPQLSGTVAALVHVDGTATDRKGRTLGYMVQVGRLSDDRAGVDYAGTYYCAFAQTVDGRPMVSRRMPVFLAGYATTQLALAAGIERARFGNVVSVSCAPHGA